MALHNISDTKVQADVLMDLGVSHICVDRAA